MISEVIRIENETFICPFCREINLECVCEDDTVQKKDGKGN